MNSRWKEAVAWVETLDEAKREELAEVVLDHMSDAEADRLRALIDEGESDIANGRTQSGGEPYWAHRRRELNESLASKS